MNARQRQTVHWHSDVRIQAITNGRLIKCNIIFADYSCKLSKITHKFDQITIRAESGISCEKFLFLPIDLFPPPPLHPDSRKFEFLWDSHEITMGLTRIPILLLTSNSKFNISITTRQQYRYYGRHCEIFCTPWVKNTQEHPRRLLSTSLLIILIEFYFFHCYIQQ